MTFMDDLLKARLVAGVVVLLLLRTAALAKEIECPSTIAVQESADLAHLEGWRTYDTSVKGAHHFFDVGFSEGPPEKLVFRTPSKSTATKLKKLDVYDFSSGVSDDIWISCQYRDTALSLTRKMADKFTRCEVAYDPTTGFRTVKRIDCY
jgi:hypothetical protein